MGLCSRNKKQNKHNNNKNKRIIRMFTSEKTEHRQGFENMDSQVYKMYLEMCTKLFVIKLLMHTY